MLEHPGRTFQSQTRYSRETMERHALDWHSRPPAYKFYRDAPVISLPTPAPMPGEEPAPDLWTCVGRRRSVRSYGAAPLTLNELSLLLWASTGMTGFVGTARSKDFYRAAPSAGALYPIETYVVANAVEGLEPGLYHYRIAGLDDLEVPTVEGAHSLEQLKTGELREEVASAALDQPMCGRAGAIFLWTAVFARSEWKYRERAYRYVYLDAGHIAAQLSLAAVALGLGSCPVAAFYDDEADSLLEIDGRSEAVIYMTAVGNPTRPAHTGSR